MSDAAGRRVRRFAARAVLCALGLALVLGGVAYASIPGAGGTISGCYSKLTGLLRVIDTDAGRRCLTGEQAVSWNQRGPAGPSGPPGPAGPAGSARGYAYIDSSGRFVPERSHGVAGVTAIVTPTGPYGGFCFDLDFAPSVVVASELFANPPDTAVRAAGPNAGQVLFRAGTSGPATCPNGFTDAAAMVFGPNMVPVFEPTGFSVLFN